MSSSRLKPSVTPATALAMRLRDRPCSLPSCGSSLAVFAVRWPSESSKLMPAGCAWRSWPFGPFTSMAPSTTLTVTPFGMVMGFLPIRDMVVSPNVAEDFAADTSLHRGSSGHPSARGRQDARAETCQHVGHIVAAEVDAATWPADALDAGDQFLAVRSVLQEQPQRLGRGRRLGRRLVEDLEARDVALVLQDAGDLGLEPRRGHVDARVLGGHRVADPREHICDWIGHSFLSAVNSQQSTVHRSQRAVDS